MQLEKVAVREHVLTLYHLALKCLRAPNARVLEPLADAGKTAVIPPRSNRSPPRDYDRHLYGERHLIENFFAKIKQFRAIATRYEKIARNFLAAIHLTAGLIWLN